MQEPKDELKRLGYTIVHEAEDHVVAVRKKWHWDCFFTKLTTIVSLRKVDKLESKDIEIDREKLAEDWKSYDSDILPRGLQRGVAVLPVYLAGEVGEEAHKDCTTAPRMRWAYFFVPACYDESTDEALFLKSNPVWGRMYYPKFRFLWQRLLTPDDAPPKEPVSMMGILLLLFILAMFVLMAVM